MITIDPVGVIVAICFLSFIAIMAIYVLFYQDSEPESHKKSNHKKRH